MSLRTTTEITRNHFALPDPGALGEVPDRLVQLELRHLLHQLREWSCVAAVVILTLVGAMAAHCLARYRFRLNRVIYFVLFSTIIFPPQITIISLFQILVQYGLYNTQARARRWSTSRSSCR